MQNSATEISTDSEFALEEPTPTREIPSIIFNDANVTKSRGNYRSPKKVQVKSGVLQKPTNGRTKPEKDIKLLFKPLVPTPVIRKPAPSTLLLRTEGYPLNRTQSTGGMATKVSLELKRKYLLGENTMPGTIQKSGSASTLDSKFKSFHSNISDCQKLLKPAPEISASMRTFCNKLDERSSPISPVLVKSPTFSTVKQTADLTTNENKDSTGINQFSDIPDKVEPFQNENEGRPRSPVHETSIIVPNINWDGSNKRADSLESSSSSESESEEKNEEGATSAANLFNSIPRVEVHDVAGEILEDNNEENILDSLNEAINTEIKSELQPSISEPLKSIGSVKKTLNQPKSLPSLQNDNILTEMHEALHTKMKDSKQEENVDKNKNSSGRSTPSVNDSCFDQATVLTETELSDWARDGAVSDDFEEDLNAGEEIHNKISPKTNKSETIKIAKISEFEDLGHVCGREKENKDNKNRRTVNECVNNILNPDLDNIEFMDTGTETSSDDNAFVEAKNNGYIQFQNEDEIPADSLNSIILNEIVETKSPRIGNIVDDFEDLSTPTKNTGYCHFGNEKTKFGEVIDLKPIDLEKLKEKHNSYENEEDSLLIVDPGTTTEENTCSDSTVKNVTEKVPQELESQVEKVNTSEEVNQEKENTQNEEYMEHCQRLTSKIEFGNVRDSIDIRKSRRKSKFEAPPKPDLIVEEKEQANIIPNLTPTKFYKKEEIEKERDKNKKLIEEMVMNKMKAQNKSLERKKRSRSSFSPIRPFDLAKSATTDIATQIKQNLTEEKPKTESDVTPDLLTTVKKSSPIQKSQTICSLALVTNANDEAKAVQTPVTLKQILRSPRPFSVHTPNVSKENSRQLPDTPLTNPEAFSLPDIKKALHNEEFRTPKAPPRLKNDEAKRTAEKLKKEARARARMLSDEDLGLSPEDKLEKLRQRVKKSKENIYIKDSIESLVLNTERRNSFLYSNDTLKKRNSFKRSKSGDGTISHNYSTNDLTRKNVFPNNSIDFVERPVRTKSVSEISNPHVNLKLLEIQKAPHKQSTQFCKSDPNLLKEPENKEKRKSKDRERRKSITKFITDIFTKKKDSPNSTTKGFFSSMISPKSKEKSKVSI